MAYTLMQQVAVIFLLVAVGVAVRKKGIVSLEAARQFCNFVMMVVTPSMLVSVFQRDYDRELLVQMGFAAVLIIAFHILSAVAAVWLFRPRADGGEAIERLGMVFSNCGFMGIPLITAAMGEVGRMFAVVYIAIFNIYLWTHGVMLIRHSNKLSAKEIFLSPGTLGAAVGIALFLLKIRLPTVLFDGVSFISAMNTPLPMILTGIFIADIPIKKTLTNLRVYAVAFLRLLGLPLVFLGLILLCGVRGLPGATDQAILGVMISCACPAAIATMMMPARFGGDTAYAAVMIAVSTVFSIATIPAVAAITQAALTYL